MVRRVGRAGLAPTTFLGVDFREFDGASGRPGVRPVRVRWTKCAGNSWAADVVAEPAMARPPSIRAHSPGSLLLSPSGSAPVRGPNVARTALWGGFPGNSRVEYFS